MKTDRCWVLKFEDGEYLYKDGKEPKWGPKRRKAFPFESAKAAFRVKNTWPQWCRGAIKVMRLEKAREKEGTSSLPHVHEVPAARLREGDRAPDAIYLRDARSAVPDVSQEETVPTLRRLPAARSSRKGLRVSGVAVHPPEATQDLVRTRRAAVAGRT